MRVLVVGAGALGGYFGASLLKVNRDVTFLVRPPRAAQLRANGLRIRSPAVDFTVAPPIVTAEQLVDHADLILVCVKSYALSQAMEQFAAAVGPNTVILPVLNGIAHMETLTARFGADRVLGGTSLAGGALDADGNVNVPFAGGEIVFGELSGATTPRCHAISSLFDGAATSARASDTIMQDMWEKFTFLAAGNGISCLMRATLGDILATPGGTDMIARACNEARDVATACGYPPRQAYVDRILGFYSIQGSPVKASMLRDIERDAPTEGEHTIGDMVRRARRYGVPTPFLDIAYCMVDAYEARRAREAGKT
ncbi:MAG: ketopantoate reductase family protein [Alphaproteobacteria bacterium]|nr:ketopantoate reductase family protein [Alphaproteobacteria bacterium]